MDDVEREALRAEGLDPDSAAVTAAQIWWRGDCRYWQILSGSAGTLPVVDCWVRGYESAGSKLHELAERQYPYGLPSEVVVCELLRGELADGHQRVDDGWAFNRR
jgi:hypothetical protein